jgi:hypothetical protein
MENEDKPVSEVSEGTKTSEMIMGSDGVERTKNEHKKYLKKIEKEQKKKEHKAKAAPTQEKAAAKPQEEA